MPHGREHELEFELLSNFFCFVSAVTVAGDQHNGSMVDVWANSRQ